MPVDPATVESATAGAKRRAVDDARDVALLRKPARAPCPGPSKPIACRSRWEGLDPLIKDLLEASEATVILRSDHYRNGTIFEFNVSFVPRVDAPDKTRIWKLSLSFLQRAGIASDPPRVKFWEGPDFSEDRAIKSESLADLERLRGNALDHVRLFRELVGEVEPAWLELHRAFFDGLDAWVRGWPPDPRTPARVVATDDAVVERRQTSASLAVDRDLIDAIRKLLAAANRCEMPPLRVHFLQGQPARDDQDDGVLAYPEQDQAGAIAKALKPILERALVPPRVSIVGQTDRVGGTEPNLKLSERRARWLRRRLAGIDLSAATVVGCGEEGAPETPGASPEFRFVEVIVEPAEGR